MNFGRLKYFSERKNIQKQEKLSLVVKPWLSDQVHSTVGLVLARFGLGLPGIVFGPRFQGILLVCC
jgi:hypothetical protein